MELDRPIFIVAAGRTGSTIYHRVLCEHPQIAWLTDRADRQPAQPARNRRLMQAADWPLVGRAVRRIYPSECYDFWEYHCPGFRRPCRDLVAGDASTRSTQRVRAALAEIPSAKRSRLSIKITGWPRLGLLHAMFPNARFIHLMRDGRSVANSFLNVPWWWGWRGPSNWRWGELGEEYAAEWLRHDRSFVALAGIQWKIFIDALERARAAIPEDQYLEIRYEDLCRDAKAVYARTLEFCELPESEIFTRALDRFELSTREEKWRRHLSADQQRILEQVLASHLPRCGYGTEVESGS